MPFKRDDSGRRWVEMEFLVPGTPEQVWQAIATGPGMSAWFTTTEIEERVGDRFETPDGTPRLAGRVERIHQDAVSREVMLRIDQPAQGIAVAGACTVGDESRVMASIYLYGSDAADIAASEQPKWTSWLRGLLEGEAVTT